MLKKSNLLVLLAVSIILASTACAPDQSSDKPTVSAPTQSPSAMPQAKPVGSQPGLPKDVLQKVAEAVGVDPQRLESAITQAMSQLAQPTTPTAGEKPPDSPRSTPGANPAGLPGDVLQKAAEALGIDAQCLETAFIQAMSQSEKDVRATPRANP